MKKCPSLISPKRKKGRKPTDLEKGKERKAGEKFWPEEGGKKEEGWLPEHASLKIPAQKKERH
jgi:hypothetical protein